MGDNFQENPFAIFRGMFNVDGEARHKLSRIKRFLERWSGDDNFQKGILDGSTSLLEAQKICGCEIDLHSLLPVFHPSYTKFRREASESDWPLTALWDSHLTSGFRARSGLAIHGSSQGVTPMFDIWRRRNMNRASLQLGLSASGITHPPVAFELSSGCSVGCWFCGVSAEKFKGHASLENGGRQQWREILESFKAYLGDGLQCSFCYWATDPLDNPEYLGFLDIFEEVTGVLPQTTTAIPLRNVELTRNVLKRWEKERSVPNRFSVITKRALLEIHETFTPDELFGVELVIQINSIGGTTKFTSGRNFQRISVKKEKSEEGTISCVSGYLVNLVEKSIRVISPTLPSPTYPNGYITFASDNFDDASDVRDVIARLNELVMRPSLVGNSPLAITRGGECDFGRAPEVVKFRDVEVENENLLVLGGMLAKGNLSPNEIVQSAIGSGMPPMKAVMAMEQMWHEGILSQVS